MPAVLKKYSAYILDKNARSVLRNTYLYGQIIEIASELALSIMLSALDARG